MEQLEKYFDTAFEAPDGVKKLRELILSVAMQGKLVPQNPKDLPAIRLLEKIILENKKLSKEGKLSLSKILDEVTPSEEPYPIPSSWKWIRLNELGIWKSGLTPSRQNHKFYGGNIPWIKSGEVKQGRIKHAEETITTKALEATSIHINPIGSVLLAMYGANIGDVGILEIEASTNQAVCACKPYTGISNEFLAFLIKSLKQNFIGQGAGAAQPNISREKIINTIVPLPPPEEQLRIVNKINELMSRCDELEKLRAVRDQKRLTVHTSAIRKMLDAPDQDTFHDAWQFITRHFSDLYTVRENVSELRKTILQLAVMGKLVKQDVREGTARELLEEIEREKKASAKNVKVNNLNLLPPLESDDLPFKVPSKWLWCKLGDLAVDVSYGTSEKAIKENIGVPVLRMGNISSNGKISFLDLKYVDSKISDLPKLFLNDQDLVFNRTNSLELVGKSAVFTEQNSPYTLASYLIRVRFNKSINPFFVSFYINSIICRQSQIIPNVVQQNGQANFNGSKLKDILIPTPPKLEQNRIVKRIDQFMVLCDTLEKQIDKLQDKQSEAMRSMMASN